MKANEQVVSDVKLVKACLRAFRVLRPTGHPDTPDSEEKGRDESSVLQRTYIVGVRCSSCY